VRAVTNTIPESTVFSLDVRANSNETMDILQQKFVSSIEVSAAQTGTTIEWKYAGYFLLQSQITGLFIVLQRLLLKF
jgi:metal-dependent amidase/aminoacylase/carboxypeptidase family protein